MRNTFENDERRRVFIGYLLTVIAVLLVIVKVSAAIASAKTVVEGVISDETTIQRIASAARGSELIGAAILAAAYLLVFDRGNEASATKVCIVISALLGVLLTAACVLGIAALYFFDASDSPFSLKASYIADYLASGVLSLAAVAICWPVVRDVSVDKFGIVATDEENE